jgi:putative endonuclease
MTPSISNQHFWYVYIIRSKAFQGRFYTGITQDLEDRLKHHNAGAVPSTKPYLPWEIKTYVAFINEKSAQDFEKYLKSQTGRAFAKKRL